MTLEWERRSEHLQLSKQTFCLCQIEIPFSQESIFDIFCFFAYIVYFIFTRTEYCKVRIQHDILGLAVQPVFGHYVTALSSSV